MRLMQARAVLDCTRVVLLYDEQLEADPKRPYHLDAVDVVRQIVDQVIESLDSNLQAAARVRAGKADSS